MEAAAAAGAPGAQLGESAGAPGQAGAAPVALVPADTRAPAPARAAVPWVLTTYFAEGLPFSIAHKVASEFFTASGASLQAIGLTGFFGAPWNLKFLWSPLIDLYGTPRRWLVFTQLAVGLATAALSWPAARGALGLAAVGFLLVALLAATQDIAVDGFYLHALDKKAQAAHSGLRVTAYRVAFSAGGGLVALAGWSSWPLAFLVGGATLVLLSLTHAVILPRPRRGPAEDPIAAATTGTSAGTSGERPRPASPPRQSYLEAFATFLRQPQVGLTLTFILLFRAGDAMMFSMTSPLLKSLGVDTATRGLLSVLGGSLASIAGSMLGGIAVARLGLARTIFPIALLQSLAIPLFVLLAWARPALPGIAAIIVLEQLAAGVGTAAFTVFIMRRCAGEYRASHFAIGTALMSVATTVAGGASGFIADRVGFVVFFAIAFAASLPGVVLARVVPTD